MPFRPQPSLQSLPSASNQFRHAIVAASFFVSSQFLASPSLALCGEPFSWYQHKRQRTLKVSRKPFRKGEVQGNKQVAYGVVLRVSEKERSHLHGDDVRGLHAIEASLQTSEPMQATSAFKKKCIHSSLRLLLIQILSCIFQFLRCMCI